MQLLLSLLAVTSVFLLVPRGVSVGTIDVHSTKMTFNSTTKTYRIILQAEVPVYNPNYLKVGAWYPELWGGGHQLGHPPATCLPLALYFFFLDKRFWSWIYKFQQVAHLRGSLSTSVLVFLQI